MIGVWILLQGVLALPALVPMIFIAMGVREMIFPIFMVGFYVWLVQILIFKAEWLIDLLRLDKDFKEERIEATIRHSSVLQIAVIVMGGISLIQVLPDLARETYFIMKVERAYRDTANNAQIFISIVQTAISYLLLTKSRSVVNLFNKDQEKPNKTT